MSVGCWYKAKSKSAGKCTDNAVTERFFRSLKTEKLYRENYAAKTAALLGIAEYIEDFYNPKRLHSALGNLSPMMFEAKQPCLTL
ncbi:integrase [Aggregatibacter actinomycetemcomitans]|uniref:Integrase n=2 Tax=Aggregatibacter actinomycetemcomitans TaxID=714 RepID=A0A5D0EKH8_AGGAC|nr:integrase core domain-containing protein [Aggregatibacter actinomycetemcomitans]KYK75182.1 integrase [Aggregatibacter actinomycetemcomitans serotype e str. SA2876]KYK84229.1 integrase [Aggregatibacter actinomycetemcomitans serotype d str. SA3033]KYK85872.1 integrase [Aggregatibacter actinomycetemcomitans serotype d str. SA2200]BAS47770.1 integrase catalytic subunit [Aggregatibacter actinomycetemcomitans NUM4039]AMQ94347.1 integrase [Aggregatibacter actinomycetemcomitans]